MSDELVSAFQAASFQMIETHISRVYLRDQEVYKTKRAVNLGFLDFTTLKAREEACEAEVELNRRLAPGVYLGVVAVVDARVGELRFVPKEQLSDEPVLEWAVHMRRLRDEDRADLRLVRGEFSAKDVAQIAALLADFHRNTRADELTASFGSPSVIAHNVEENFHQIADTVGEYLDGTESAALASFQRTFMRDQERLFEKRARDGFVRDGHGDLRLEHLYKTASDAYVAIDCIEFNERFRYGDVCSDLAFLVMDLAYHERTDLADLLIAGYAQESGDYALYALLDFYQSYRAVVRAKVSSMLAHDLSVAPSTRERAQQETRRYYLLAMSVSRQQLAPTRIIVTFGLIASGKSTLSQSLSERLGIAVLSADRTRKELLFAKPTDDLRALPFQGAYAAEMTEKVYNTLFERAVQILRSGRSVILDATFRSRAHRARVCELAATMSIDVFFLECRCPRDLTMRRLHKRAEAPSISDATAEVFETFAARFEPTGELDPSEHLVLDTSAPREHVLDAALAHLGTR